MAKAIKRSKQFTESMEWTHVQTLVVEEKEQDTFFLLESSEHGTCFYQYDTIDQHDIHATSCKQQWQC
jgi:hypothetical protein